MGDGLRAGATVSGREPPRQPLWVRRQCTEAGPPVRRLRDSACTDRECDWYRACHDCTRPGASDRSRPPHIRPTNAGRRRPLVVQVPSLEHQDLGDPQAGALHDECRGASLVPAVVGQRVQETMDLHAGEVMRNVHGGRLHPTKSAGKGRSVISLPERRLSPESRKWQSWAQTLPHLTPHARCSYRGRPDNLPISGRVRSVQSASMDVPHYWTADQVQRLLDALANSN